MWHGESAGLKYNAFHTPGLLHQACINTLSYSMQLPAVVIPLYLFSSVTCSNLSSCMCSVNPGHSETVVCLIDCIIVWQQDSCKCDKLKEMKARLLECVASHMCGGSLGESTVRYLLWQDSGKQPEMNGRVAQP